MAQLEEYMEARNALEESQFTSNLPLLVVSNSFSLG
jgi:hypothetical protein